MNSAWAVFEDEAGQSMTPPRARTWGRQGSTPVVYVRGRGSGRVSMPRMTCYKPGERSRLIYVIREYRGREDEPKGFGWKDHRDLVLCARTQLGGAIVLVRDNFRMHLVAPLREFFEANTDWFSVFQLPEYAPGGVILRSSRRSDATSWAAEHARAAGSARRSRSPAVPRQPRRSRARPAPG